MNTGILVLNAGSSSLRFAVYGKSDKDEALSSLLEGHVSGIGATPVFSAKVCSQDESENRPSTLDGYALESHQEAIDAVLSWIEKHSHDLHLAGAGHRVVHGGEDRHHPARVTSELIGELEGLSRLAPHHQPHNLAAIRAVAVAKPDLPQVACFDTGFHSTQSTTARSLPLPRELSQQGLQRYGFHGLSCEYITSAIPSYNEGHVPEKLIIAHLGNGASLTAVKNGKSVATSMGFSTLDGLMMGTRCGTIDPGVLLYLMRQHKMDESELTNLLYDRCGLLGVSGISGDMRVLLDSEAPAAREAIELYCFTLQRAIGAMAATLGGVDAIVFTGGIGENACGIRKQVCERLQWLGVHFDQQANEAGGPQLCTLNSRVKIWVIPTNEELVIARHTMQLI